MAEPSDLLTETLDRLNKLTVWALTTLLTIAYATLHHDTVIVIDEFRIDVQFIGTIVYLLLSAVNIYVAAGLQSSRTYLLVAEKDEREARESRGETVETPVLSRDWWRPSVFLHPRTSLVDPLREQYRTHPWLCNPYRETGAGPGRVTDCMGVVLLCLLWTFGGYIARYYRPVLSVPAPIVVKNPDAVVQGMRNERAAYLALNKAEKPARAPSKADSVFFPVAAPDVPTIDGGFVTVVMAQATYVFSFLIVLMVLISSLHEVAIDPGLLTLKIVLTSVGGAFAVFIGFSAINCPPPADLHQPLVLLAHAPRLTADVNIPKAQPPVPEASEQQLTDAVKREDFKTVTELIDKGVPATARDDDGTPALVLAADRSEFPPRPDIVSKLLSRTTEPITQRDAKGRTALYAAAEQDNHELVGNLANYARNLGDCEQIAQVILLALDHHDSALLDKAGALTCRNQNGPLTKTANARLDLHKRGAPFDPQWLVRYVSRKLENNEQALSIKIAGLFKQAGAPLTARDEDGSNLLMLAYRWHNTDLAKFLVDDRDDDFYSAINRFHEDACTTWNRYCRECEKPRPCSSPH